MLSVGQSDLYPAFTKVSPWNNRHHVFSKVENENPLHVLIGRFNLAFVVVYPYRRPRDGRLPAWTLGPDRCPPRLGIRKAVAQHSLKEPSRSSP